MACYVYFLRAFTTAVHLITDTGRIKRGVEVQRIPVLRLHRDAALSLNGERQADGYRLRLSAVRFALAPHEQSMTIIPKRK